MTGGGKSKYDVVVLGAGHNGLVAAGYLARAGLSVLVLERKGNVGGASVSARIFPDYDANISRYAYLVSLLPEKIVRDLGLRLELRTRATASFTPHGNSGLILSNADEGVGRTSMRELTGSEREFTQMQKFYGLARVFAEKVWDSMLQPLRGREEVAKEFAGDELSREAWRALVEEPLGNAVERYLEHDLVRGLVFTDAKIGLFTDSHDESLLQNRCFLYHLMGNRTGEWRVPVGGMGVVTWELERVTREAGVEIMTGAEVRRLDFDANEKELEFEIEGRGQTVGARVVLVNFGANVLARLLGRKYEPDATHEGSVVKINMLLERLPRLKAPKVSARAAFCGTFHIDEGYEQMETSYQQAAGGSLPDKVPCEVYCHTLTDDSILSTELRGRGFQTMTLFALDAPWRLFAVDNEVARRRAVERCLAGLNRHLADPIENCLARQADGELCLEARTPVDLEQELGLYCGNIFHGALTFPFAEKPEAVGTWGVETEFPNVFFCGSSARRGGGVSGIPGHNAAMKTLEVLKGRS